MTLRKELQRKAICKEVLVFITEKSVDLCGLTKDDQSSKFLMFL